MQAAAKKLSLNANISLGVLYHNCLQKPQDALTLELINLINSEFSTFPVVTVEEFIQKLNANRTDEYEENKHNVRPAWSIHHAFLINILDGCISYN